MHVRGNSSAGKRPTQKVQGKWPEYVFVSLEPRIFKSPFEKDASKLPSLPLADYLIGRLKDNGLDKTEEVWVEDASTGARVYFKEVEENSGRVASGLTRLGFKKDDILYYATYETAVLYLLQVGVWRLAGAVRGGFQQESPEEYARQMREARSRFVLGDADTLPRIKEAVKLLDWDVTIIAFGDLKDKDVVSVRSLLEDDGSAMPSKVEIDPKEDVVVIPNTSASTGLPKGACHSHFNMMVCNYDSKSIDVFQWTFMTPMSNYAIGCFVATCSSITNGATIIHLGKFVKEQYFEQLLKYKPGNCMMFPFVANWFARCEELDRHDLSFLHAITITGSILDTTTAELITKKLPHVKIIQFYGMSECGTVSNTEVDATPKSAGNRKIASCINEGELCVSSGKLVPYVEAKVVDVATGKMLGPNARGEIFVKTPMLMKGYLREGHKKPVLEGVDKEGWLATGDIGFFDPEGNIYIKERTKFLFKYYMFIVSPTEIEAVLQQHPDVLEVGVVDIPHPESTSAARAFVRRQANARCSEQDLVTFVAERLPAHKQLHGGVQFVDKLPESKGNKLDRMALRKMALLKKKLENL